MASFKFLQSGNCVCRCELPPPCIRSYELIIKVLIIRQCFEMYTSLILIMVECQFVDDGDERETLGMPTVEDRDSMWYGTTPVPRMIRNHLGHLLELNMIRLNREVKKALLKMAQKKDRKMCAY